MNEKGKPRKVLYLDKEATRIVNEKQRRKTDKDFSRSASAISLAMDMGFAIALPVAGGALLGVYLDKRFGTSPKLTLLLLFLGLFIGVYGVYQTIKKTA